jgi:hypothetical protein
MEFMYFFRYVNLAILGFALSGGAVAQEREGIATERSHGSPSVRSAQQALKDAGYYHGDVDGIEGPRTREAVRKYQQAEGLNTSGILDRETLGSLGVREGSAARRTVREAGQEAGNLAEDAKKPVREAGREADKLVDNAKEPVREAGREAEKLTQDAKQPVREAGREADKLVDNAKEPVREAGRESEKLVDRAKEPVGEARDEAGRLTERAKDRVKSAGGAVGEALGEVKRAVTGGDPETEADRAKRTAAEKAEKERKKKEGEKSNPK